MLSKVDCCSEKLGRCAMDKHKNKFIRLKKEPVVTMILHFADHHQDFLQWHLDRRGVVVKSEPFQTGIWKGTEVQRHESLKPGDIVFIKNKHIGYTTLNYRVEKIEKIKEVSNG